MFCDFCRISDVTLWNYYQILKEFYKCPCLNQQHYLAYSVFKTSFSYTNTNAFHNSFSLIPNKTKRGGENLLYSVALNYMYYIDVLPEN